MRIISFILFVLLALPSFGQYRDVRMPEQPKGSNYRDYTSQEQPSGCTPTEWQSRGWPLIPAPAAKR